MASFPPSKASSVNDPFHDANRVSSTTSVSFPSGADAQPRMRSTLLPISLTTTDDQETLNRLEVPKPWREKPNPRGKITYVLVYGMLSVGVAVSK